MQKATALSLDSRARFEFIADDHIQGLRKDVYFSPDRRHAVALYRKAPANADLTRLNNIAGPMRRKLLESPAWPYFRGVFSWPLAAVRAGDRVGYVTDAYPQGYFFPEKGPLGGLLKEALWYASARNSRHLPDLKGPDRTGGLKGLLAACLHVSRAVGLLHQNRVFLPGLNAMSCLVDPESWSACVTGVDRTAWDGDGCLHEPPAAPYCLAPETVRALWPEGGGRGPFDPSVWADRHALATLVYGLLFRRHPLLPGKPGGPDDGPGTLEAREIRALGREALFIEDREGPVAPGPEDEALQPWADCARLPYTMLGHELAGLFVRAFRAGLADPAQRPEAWSWEQALLFARDLLIPCEAPSCPSSWYYYAPPSGPANSLAGIPAAARPVCPYCGAPYARASLPVLKLSNSPDYDQGSAPAPNDYSGRSITVYDRMSLFPWHAAPGSFPFTQTSQEARRMAGYFSFREGKWLLINESLKDLHDITDEKPKPVPFRQSVTLGDGQRLCLSVKGMGEGRVMRRIAEVTILKF
ncbi:MAG: hypothetical protein LBW85_11970 [Deltaproteobacteria bacterium]|jgi:hypothetical protein|nr:hypothetical protein [Deltaproteobacteria bacterium]